MLTFVLQYRLIVRPVCHHWMVLQSTFVLCYCHLKSPNPFVNQPTLPVGFSKAFNLSLLLLKTMAGLLLNAMTA